MAKITPGIWEARAEKLFQGQHVAGRTCAVVTIRETVAKVYKESDARLIAAAPELLVACKQAKLALYNTHLEESSEGRNGQASKVVAIIESAIAKAEGR